MKKKLCYCLFVALLLGCSAKRKLYLGQSDPLLGSCWTFLGFIMPNGELDAFPSDYDFKIGFDPGFKVRGEAIYPDYRGCYKYKNEKIFISAYSTVAYSHELDALTGGAGYVLPFIRRYNAVLSSNKPVKFTINGDELLIYTQSGRIMKYRRDYQK